MDPDAVGELRAMIEAAIERGVAKETRELRERVEAEKKRRDALVHVHGVATAVVTGDTLRIELDQATLFFALVRDVQQQGLDRELAQLLGPGLREMLLKAELPRGH